jgi:ATP-dependent DNA helicase RecQ
VASYSVLRLTPAARPLLRGEERLTLARPRVKAKPLKKAARRRPGQHDYDEELFQSLRILRKRLADAAGVPPFVVFGDATLAEMAACQPTCEEALLQINGVGRHKFERYGADFLAEIRRHRGD